MKTSFLAVLSLSVISSTVLAGGHASNYKLTPDPEGQYFRLGACPDKHACVLPPTESQFVTGGLFDLRVEMHAYDEDTSKPTPAPYKNFKTVVKKDNGDWVDASRYFHQPQPVLEQWNFNWTQSLEVEYAKLLHSDANPVNVDVTSRIWRKLKFDRPGTYYVKVEYGPKKSYTARYKVVDPKKPKHKAKNVILFISDGTNTGAITAARAIARKHTSGKYHDLLSFEDFDQLGHVITNSVDSLLTDSANSASAYSTGHKSSVNALGVYADSSSSPFDDPKVESITELIRRRTKKAIGICTTAYGQDATPAAFYTHTRKRDTSAAIVDQLLYGVKNWTSPVLPDVFLAGGAEYYSGKKSLNGKDYYKELTKAGYKSVFNKKELKKYNGKDKLFGVFRQGNLDVWLERNVYMNNTVGNKAHPDNSGTKDALGTDQPGLADMTLKALETLKKRGGKDGFFLMSEAASVDKKFHTFDYPRAFGDLIELDITVQKTVEWLKKNGEYDNTLILVTADHAHSFDVYGTVDTDYMRKARDDEHRTSAIGVYQYAGFPGYAVGKDGFPTNWSPRITLSSGTNNGPAHYEAWQISANAPRYPSTTNDHGVIVPNPKDMAGNFGNGLLINNNLPHGSDQGVHSMSDVFIYSNGPGSELFKKTFENWELFFKMAEAMDLGQKH